MRGSIAHPYTSTRESPGTQRSDVQICPWQMRTLFAEVLAGNRPTAVSSNPTAVEETPVGQEARAHDTHIDGSKFEYQEFEGLTLPGP